LIQISEERLLARMMNLPSRRILSKVLKLSLFFLSSLWLSDSAAFATTTDPSKRKKLNFGPKQPAKKQLHRRSSSSEAPL
jgi:hypothetical protein